MAPVSVDDPARVVSQAERSAAITLVRAAAEDGRLDPVAVDALTQQARQARVAGQLAPVLAAVVPRVTGATGASAATGAPAATVPGAGASPVGSTPGPRLPEPGYHCDDRLSLVGGWNGESRRGRWTVPPYLKVQAIGSGVRVDCSHAVASSEYIDLEVGAGLSSVVLIVPPTWGVNVDRLSKGIGSVKMTASSTPVPGNPTILVHGVVGAGSFKARTPTWLDRRRA